MGKVIATGLVHKVPVDLRKVIISSPASQVDLLGYICQEVGDKKTAC